MKMSRASQYAVAAVVHLARQDGRQATSNVIAAAEGIPERFLFKVLRPLVSAQVLHSVKGPRGGYRMAKPASHITLLEVIEAVEGPIRGEAGDRSRPGPIQAVCDRVAGAVRRRLAGVTLAGLAKGRR